MLINDFKNKVVIITGASGSLGRELAFNLARQGAWISLAARDRKRLEEVSQECTKLGAKTMIVETNVAQEDQCQRLIDETVRKFGRIDALINNAAFSIKEKFADLPDLNSYKQVIAVNYFGCVYCTRFALPHLKKSRGRIIGVSSVLGKIATQGNTAYCSSKFAQSAFFDVLRLELIGTDVSVTMIYPGYLAERMNSKKKDKISEVKNIFLPILMMKAKTCADKIIKAAIKRKRQVTMPFYCVVAVWLNFIMPGLLGSLVSLLNKNRGNSA
ncbi:SDR family oxidoreductase [Candidatus Margulisiibacteriota bacterium]